MKLFLEECARQGIQVRSEGFDDYLRDESRLQGYAGGVVIPRAHAHVCQIMRIASNLKVPITVVSGKTSLTGAPVPLGGAVLDMKLLNSVNPNDPSRVGPGIILADYKKFLSELGFFFPPDPTSQDSCTLGGAAACNASGALSFLYGPTRNSIVGLKVVLASGTLLQITRNQVRSSGGVFTVPRELLSPTPEKDLVLPAPNLPHTDWKICKNSAGLFSEPEMDLVDMFLGSEGILGIIVELVTRLLPKRNPFFSMMLFIPDRDTAVSIVRSLVWLRDCAEACNSSHAASPSVPFFHEPGGLPLFLKKYAGLIAPSCAEWLHNSTAAFLSEVSSRQLHASYGALYVEQDYPEGESYTEKASLWAELIEETASLTVSRKEIASELAADSGRIRQMKRDRLRVPEALNEAILPGMTRIGLDFSLPMDMLHELLRLYDSYLPPDISYIYGHIGNAHLHANILPRHQSEVNLAKEAYTKIAREFCRLGGSLSGEHGIGKLKHNDLKMMMGTSGLEEIRRIKTAFDPDHILNRQTMIAFQPGLEC
jgi:D-lactate dehydrogenase (cytochrome)